MKIYVKGSRAEVNLDKKNYLTSGGEGDIYVKGDTVYKICHKDKMIPEGKFKELSVLDNPLIVKPENIIIDSGNHSIGYTMKYLKDTVNLCQLFPKPFRVRSNITNDMMLALIRQMQQTIQNSIHPKNILIVDLNELNFLVDDKFKNLYFIDVNSYQTPTYPALAIMDSIRDRHATKFTTTSDWFSFAVVSFQMFIGIHPYKGKHPKFPDAKTALEDRMKRNISIFNSEVAYPKGACQDLSVIPPSYLDWYKRVFDKGERLAPPTDLVPIITVVPVKVKVVGNKVEIVKIREFDTDIVGVFDEIYTTKDGVIFRKQLYKKHGTVAFTNIPVIVNSSNDKVTVTELITGKDYVVAGKQFMVYDGRIYVHNNDTITELININGNMLCQIVGNVMNNATLLKDGVACQNLFGVNTFSFFPKSKECYQLVVKELDRHKIIDAKFYRGVLMCLTVSNGKYHRHIIKINNRFDEYAIRTTNDVHISSINFTVLDNGTCVLINDEDEIEIFRADKDSTDVKVVQDPSIEQDMNLFAQGNQVCFYKDNSTYSIKMK